MSAAKKINSGRKTKKAALAEVIEIQTQMPPQPDETPDEPTNAAVVDLTSLAGSLTRPRGLSDTEVEAMLAARPEKPETPRPDENPTQDGNAAEVSQSDVPPGRDMTRIALFISLGTVILLLGLYMRLNQDIETLNLQVRDLSAVKTTVSTLDTKIGTMETRVADLESLPAKTRAALMSSILQEMSQKTSYMSTQLDSPEQQDKLMRAKELIQQVQTELNAGN